VIGGWQFAQQRFGKIEHFIGRRRSRPAGSRSETRMRVSVCIERNVVLFLVREAGFAPRPLAAFARVRMMAMS